MPGVKISIYNDDEHGRDLQVRWQKLGGEIETRTLMPDDDKGFFEEIEIGDAITLTVIPTVVDEDYILKKAEEIKAQRAAKAEG